MHALVEPFAAIRLTNPEAEEERRAGTQDVHL